MSALVQPQSFVYTYSFLGTSALVGNACNHLGEFGIREAPPNAGYQIFVTDNKQKAEENKNNCLVVFAYNSGGETYGKGVNTSVHWYKDDSKEDSKMDLLKWLLTRLKSRQLIDAISASQRLLREKGPRTLDALAVEMGVISAVGASNNASWPIISDANIFVVSSDSTSASIRTYNDIREEMNPLRDVGLVVHMVQIGNESAGSSVTTLCQQVLEHAIDKGITVVRVSQIVTKIDRKWSIAEALDLLRNSRYSPEINDPHLRISKALEDSDSDVKASMESALGMK